MGTGCKGKIALANVRHTTGQDSFLPEVCDLSAHTHMCTHTQLKMGIHIHLHLAFLTEV